MTRDALKTFIDSKIDNTGQRLTTGNRTRDAFDGVIDAMFDQFGEVYTETVDLVSNTDKVVEIDAATYGGTIRTYTIFDSSGYDITQSCLVQRGVNGSGNQTLTINRSKTSTNVEVNITLR